MNEALITSLRERLEALHQHYRLHFAGQVRATRDQELIERLIEDALVIEHEAGAGDPNGGADTRQALLALCAERLELYRAERDAVEAAVAELGPEGIEAVRLGEEANSVLHRYRRHFAGQSRGTRDLGLLEEMLEDLRTIDSAFANLQTSMGRASIAENREAVANQIRLLETEREEIRTARDAGTLDERAGRLASVANDLFTLYGQLFAGQPRVSRRPELLQRMMAQLQAVLARMEGLQEVGLHTQHNRDNIAVVRGRLEGWERELQAIREARQQTPLLAMVEALGEAADATLQVYNAEFAGQDRASRDLALLGALCTRMGELVRQMKTLSRVRPMRGNDRNLSMALDALHMLETEWDEVARAQEVSDAPE